MTTADQHTKQELPRGKKDAFVKMKWVTRTQVAERFHIPTLEDDGYLIDNSYKKSCREILSSKKKIKWPVYNKSALIGTLKKNPKNKRIFQGETGLGAAAVIGSIQMVDGFIGFGL